MIKVSFEAHEVDFLKSLINNISVKPSSADAAHIVTVVTAILAKLNATEAV